MQKFSLTIPGIGETATTLAHPTPLRLIPWLIVLEGIIHVLSSALPKVSTSLNRYPVMLPEPGMILLSAIIYLAIAYFLASRIKHGDMVFVWAVRIGSVLSIGTALASLIQGYIFITNYQEYFLGTDYFTPPYIARQILSILVSVYMLYVLFKYVKALRAGGESFKKQPAYSEKIERLAHRAGIAVIIAIPILYGVGVSLWSVSRITQRFVQENNIPTYQYGR
jgi:hypothetical protein